MKRRIIGIPCNFNVPDADMNLELYSLVCRMDKVQELGNPDCYAPSSEPFRIDI
jgi:hypothetical protein